MINRLINSIRTDSKTHRRSLKGVITVEATLVFPLFFFCIWMFWQLFLLLLYEVDVARTIAKTNPTIQAIGGALREGGGEKVENIEKMYTSAFSTALVFRVDHRAGFPLIKAERGDNEYYRIEVSVLYLIRSPFFFSVPISLKQSFELRPAVGTWYNDAFAEKTKQDNGTQNNKEEKDGEEKNKNEKAEAEEVYVTTNGKVYHKSKACSFISLSIRESSEKQVFTERNRDGRKYKECTLCSGETHTGFVYITDYGEYFHYSTGCRALQRMASTVPLSQVGNLKPCSRCGKNQ